MNMKRFTVASIVLFLFLYSYEFVVHGMLLTNIYLETPQIWRNYNEMMAYIPFNIGAKAALAIWFTFIFTQFFKEGGWGNGLRFGIYLGVLSGIQVAEAYFYLPISATLSALWLIISLIGLAIGGLIIGAIYRK